jgi:hypothetical protein
MHSHSCFSLASAALVVAFALPTQAQLFTNGSAQVPQTGSNTEAVDFADIDLDGDWDAAIADGGDTQQDQDRLWVNQGGAQGGALGFFVDVTAVQAPIVMDQSRDIEFADLDADGDADLHVSNDAQLLNQGCRFWINLGGEQQGTAGFFADQTSTHWVGVGGPGSSVAPAAVLVNGSFIDWTSDSDFADLDLDGDIDLLHSSHGGSFGGQTPTRVFLNDGAGHFSEFNPSLFQLPSTTIANGHPGLWSEGMQSTNTTNTSGVFCDVATSAVGIELVDTDADFDIDLLLGSRQEAPRCFGNRYFEKSGALGFRDLTSAVFPSGYWSGGDNYEQEFADMDGDGDADLFGLNWPGLNDAIFVNQGNGVFGPQITLPSSGTDGNDGEFCDFTGDGALELYVAGFSTTDKIYQGTPGQISFMVLTQSGITSSGNTLMARACDVDADGDYDVLTAQDGGNHEILWLNTQAGTQDDQAPYVPHVKPIADQTAQPAPLVALAQVYDNVSLRMLEANDTRVELSVDGCAMPDSPAQILSTQVARAELPGNLVGSVSWRFASTDLSGNTGVSAQQAYTATSSAGFAFGYGAGSAGSLGVPTVHAMSVPFAGSTLYLAGKGAPPATLSWLALTTANAPSAPLGVPGLCNVNVLGSILALKVAATDATGCSVAALQVPVGAPAGIDVYAQFLSLDGQGGNLLSSSAGLHLVTQ